MRVFVLSALILGVFGMQVAAAAEPKPSDGAAPPVAARQPAGRAQPSGSPLKPVEDADARKKRLDALFADLKHEASAAKAEAIANRIGTEWSQSGSATVDLLVQRATLAMAKQDSAAAFDFLDQAIILQPNYAEAWNRRATLNYTSSSYGKSLDDIRSTLRLEPRHYGALLGLAAILEETDRKEKALETYLHVLDIYPALKPAQDAAGRLSDELAGQAL